jgi:hypothetical protein
MGNAETLNSQSSHQETLRGIAIPNQDGFPSAGLLRKKALYTHPSTKNQLQHPSSITTVIRILHPKIAIASFSKSET